MKTKEELIQFEKDIVTMYKEGKLRSPLHLSGGNEKELIRLFKFIKPQDWVFTTYRSHYHALLKGVSEDWLKTWILNNKSIHVMNSEYKIFSSAIVGGTLSIALGVAMGIKLKYQRDDLNIEELDKLITPRPTVYCFIGDMTASTGVFHDCWRYAVNHNLPIHFVIEDNGLSTDTPTKEVWGMKEDDKFWYESTPEKISYYKYKRIYPHYGCGVFVEFTEELKQDGKF